MRTRKNLLAAGTACLFASIFTACGGGNGTPPPPPTKDFGLSVSYQTLSVEQGFASQALSVSVSAVNGFSDTVNLSASSLPTGVAMPPSTLAIASPGSTPVTFTASSSAATGTSTVTLKGTSG